MHAIERVRTLEEVMPFTWLRDFSHLDNLGGSMRLNMRLFTAGVLGAGLLLAVGGCQQSDRNVQAARENEPSAGKTTNKAVLNDSDRDFLKKAEDGDIKERNIGRVVLEKSQNKDVKDYAQTLVDDHTKDLRRVVDLMNEKGMPQPKDLPEVKHEAIGKLDRLSGDASPRPGERPRSFRATVRRHP